MSDDLLSHYNRELSFLRKLGAEFAEQHPKIAGRLRMSGDVVEDPHVSRLQEGVAFLNARIRKKLDDEFPELTDGLLGHLYPHYLAPIPSMAIVQFRSERDLAQARTVPSGTEMLSEPISEQRCGFRTTQPAQLLPVAIERVALSGRPLIGPITPAGAVGVLRMSLGGLSRETSFSKLQTDFLRFFLRGPQAQALQLYELILNGTVALAVARPSDDREPLVLDASAIRAVGFAADEGMLPYPARSSLGYRLLTEYFTFPEKFLFFDVAGIGGKLASTSEGKLDLFFYVSRFTPELQRTTTAESFALGCAPVVNLFRKRAEPIPITGASAEYLVTPDSRQVGALEVYSVDRVTISSQLNGTGATPLRPIFGPTHAGAVRRETRFWHASRRRGLSSDDVSDVYLSFVDLGLDPSMPPNWVASVETTCTNGTFPAKLPFGGGHPLLRLVGDSAGVAALTCLTPPTAPPRLPSRDEGAWRLISHLSLNHLSLAQQAAGPEPLREVMRLYDFRDAPETRAMINSLVGVEATRSAARAPDRAMGVFCRGLDVTLEFDDESTSGSGVFLLASVLQCFLAHYASINSFVRLTAKVKGRSGVLRTWPPRAGDLNLL
jgi:type VI secretion system protein ImpG